MTIKLEALSQLTEAVKTIRRLSPNTGNPAAFREGMEGMPTDDLREFCMAIDVASLAVGRVEHSVVMGPAPQPDVAQHPEWPVGNPALKLFLDEINSRGVTIRINHFSLDPKPDAVPEPEKPEPPQWTRQDICRFHSMDAAHRVAEAAQVYTDVRLAVARIPSEDNTKANPHKIGEFVITTHDVINPDAEKTYLLSKCVDAGLLLAFARALRKVDPKNPLLTIWHLREENVPAYKFYPNRSWT